MHFHYVLDLYGNAVATQQNNPCPLIMKLSSLVDPSFVFVTLHLFPGVDEMIFKEKLQFCTFYPKIIS